jgi:hypothetical protein
MPDNRWQVGVWGNYTDTEDEDVRQAIDATKQRLSCSSSEAAKWLIRSAYARINETSEEAPTIQQSTAYASPVTVDNSEVIEAINSGFAMLARKLENINVMQAPAETQREETPTEAEDRLLDTGMSEAALVALKTRVFKPGRRLES